MPAASIGSLTRTLRESVVARAAETEKLSQFHRWRDVKTNAKEAEKNAKDATKPLCNIALHLLRE
jgi:hypothetical protein